MLTFIKKTIGTLSQVDGRIGWSDDRDWTLACDFPGNDITSIDLTPELCGGTCSNVQGCSHYVFREGVCHLKAGAVVRDDAVFTGDSMVCGVKDSSKRPQCAENCAEVVWNGNTATACDFLANNLRNAPTSKEKCAETCSNTRGCTHFAWTTFNRGTCWMKTGTVSKSDAFHTNDDSMICGVVD